MGQTAFIARPRLVLASSSPRRRQALEMLGVDPVLAPADIDETPRPDESPEALVIRLAIGKAEAVDAAGNGVIVAADTVVAVDGEILGKPVDEADARRMLEALSGRDHDVVTGVAVRAGDRTEHELASAVVTMRPLSSADIDWYVATGEPMDKAGAYGIQGIGGLFVTDLRGLHGTVVGFHLPVVDAVLSRFGRPLPTWVPRG